MTQYIRILIIGFIMGSADLVPGVSGGTIAFISGIYQTLIKSIKTVTSEVPKLLLQLKIKEAFQIIPFKFLIPLFAGIFIAILSLSKILEHLLRTQETLTLSFFFGLVLASIYLISLRIKTWTITSIIAIPVTTIIGYLIATLSPTQTPDTPLAFFISGMIAICAMILPGISGSFLLLIMGKYSQILSAVNDRDFITLMIFMAGAVIGIAIFSQILNWLFKKHHDITIASLIGLMSGSIARIWPWKTTLEWRTNSHGIEEPLHQINIAPQENIALPIILMLIGAAIIYSLHKLQEKTK